MFILLLFIVFLTWRWVSEYIRSCQSSKPLAWYQKLTLGLHSSQQLCSMELWHIIKLRRNPQVRKGNSSSTAMKFQLACPPKGVWPATLTILCTNPSLKTQSLLTTLLLFIPETRLQQDLHSIRLMVFPQLVEDFPTRSGFQWLVWHLQNPSFLSAFNREQCCIFHKVPNSPLISWIYIEQWNIYKWSRGSAIDWNELWVRSQKP